MTSTLRRTVRDLVARTPGAAAAVLLIGAALLLLPDPADAQSRAAELGQQRLGRAYWHVFASYAIAWLLIFGWIVATFRRLRRIEDRLSDSE